MLQLVLRLKEFQSRSPMVDLLEALWTFVEGLAWLSFLGEGKSQSKRSESEAGISDDIGRQGLLK
jgi:hypothetical protein